MRRLALACISLATLLAAPAAAGQEVFSLQRPRPLETEWALRRDDTLSLLFLGDIMLHKGQLDAARQPDGSYRFTPFLDGLRPLIEEADITVANMEFPLAGPPYTGYPSFSAPDAYAEYAADCGIDVFLAANNHILDKGQAGLERTLRTYAALEDSRSVHVTGIAAGPAADSLSYPLIIERRGARIALLNFTYGTNAGGSGTWPKVNRLHRDDIAAAIGRAKRQGADILIALPHWGTEYELRHSRAQHETAVWLAEQGVDLIVGAHPHVVQDMETLGTPDGRQVPVYYSLGNAVSNMSAPNTRLELALRVEVVIHRNGYCELLPPQATYLWCTLPGRLTGSYATIPVCGHMGQRDRWRIPYDYDNMIATYLRVKRITGINDL